MPKNKLVIPYIYMITFKPDGRVYIGSRFNSRGCCPSEFWKEGGYFTSSKHVKKLIAEYGTDSAIWEVQILQVFEPTVDLKTVPKIENEYIVDYVERNGAANIINRRWFIGETEIYTNAGMKYSDESKKKIADRMKGYVTAKDKDGNFIKVSKEEFTTRDDLTGISHNKRSYHCPITFKRVHVPEGCNPPEGYLPGLGPTLSDEGKKKLSEIAKGHCYINNGEVNKKIQKTDDIPEGWVLGRLKYNLPGWTEERRQKFKNTFAEKRANKPPKVKPPKPPKVPVKRTPEEIEANIQTQKQANERRKELGIPHGNAGRKRTEESIRKQAESRKRNKEIKQGF